MIAAQGLIRGQSVAALGGSWAIASAGLFTGSPGLFMTWVFGDN